MVAKGGAESSRSRTKVHPLGPSTVTLKAKTLNKRIATDRVAPERTNAYCSFRGFFIGNYKAVAMEKYIVYKHTTPGGKVYIGQTKKDIHERWKDGKGYTCHHHGWFWKAIEKYGWNNIRHEILCDDLSKTDADYYEKYFIAIYQSTDKRYGYNCQSGGSSGYEYTEESRKRISEGLKKRYAIQKPDTSKAREVLQAKQGRKIVQYDLSGKKINEFDSAMKAEQITGVRHQSINLVLIKRSKQTGGYMWRYIEDAPPSIPPYRIKKSCGQYDTQGNLIKVWDDVKAADKYFAFGKKKRVLAEKCCEGKGYKTAYGFVWKYI